MCGALGTFCSTVKPLVGAVLTFAFFARLNYLGCHGGVKSLETARALAAEQRGALVLVVCCELCSMHKFPPRMSAGPEALKVRRESLVARVWIVEWSWDLGFRCHRRFLICDLIVNVSFGFGFFFFR